MDQIYAQAMKRPPILYELLVAQIINIIANNTMCSDQFLACIDRNYFERCILHSEKALKLLKLAFTSSENLLKVPANEESKTKLEKNVAFLSKLIKVQRMAAAH